MKAIRYHFATPPMPPTISRTLGYRFSQESLPFRAAFDAIVTAVIQIENNTHYLMSAIRRVDDAAASRQIEPRRAVTAGPLSRRISYDFHLPNTAPKSLPIRRRARYFMMRRMLAVKVPGLRPGQAAISCRLHIAMPVVGNSPCTMPGHTCASFYTSMMRTRRALCHRRRSSPASPLRPRQISGRQPYLRRFDASTMSFGRHQRPTPAVAAAATPPHKT